MCNIKSKIITKNLMRETPKPRHQSPQTPIKVPALAMDVCVCLNFPNEGPAVLCILRWQF